MDGIGGKLMDELELQRVLARRIFGSPDAAALHALNSITETGYEMGGGILRDSGNRYSYTEPAGDKRTGKFTARIGVPKSQQLVGLYHTHPQGEGDRNAEMFSADDVAVADAMKWLSYIKALNSGNVRKYEPGKTPRKNMYPHGKVSEGELLRQALAQELMRDPLDIARQSK